MPGFNIGSGDRREPYNKIETLRAHRWMIEKLGPVSSQKLSYAKSITLPGFSVEEEVVVGSSTKYKFAKLVNWEDVTVSFYDVGLVFPNVATESRAATPNVQVNSESFEISSTIFSDIKAWQEAVYTTGGGIGLANNYKDNSIFVLTDGFGNNVNPRFVLHGSWPKSITHSPLSYESSDIKLVEMTLSYDFVTYE